ncbi:MAG: hypothetical protein AB4041_13060 [Microcystaceae cyanobacterium]
MIDDYTEGGSPVGFCAGVNLNQCTHFNTLPPFIPNPTLEDTQTGFTNVIGGSRQLNIAGSTLNNTTEATAGQDANFGISQNNPQLSLANRGGFNSKGTATYDANGSGLNLGAGNTIDFDLSTFDFFEFRFTGQDQNARLTLAFTSNLGEGSEVTQDVFQDLNAFAVGETERIVQFSLSDFNQINFTDIDRIAFSIEGTANNLDAEFDLVQFGQEEVVELPEPGTLLGLGSLSLSIFGGKVIRYIKLWGKKH